MQREIWKKSDRKNDGCVIRKHKITITISGGGHVNKFKDLSHKEKKKKLSVQIRTK